jgi:hypothetical protein
MAFAAALDYMWQTPTTRVWEKLHNEGKLTPAEDAFWRTKPPEELYDLEKDPDEVQNLANVAAHQEIKTRLATAQHEHALKIRDIGFIPEGERLRRAKNRSLYDLGHDNADYPLARVLETAELASLLEASALPALKTATRDRDSAVRYWAVLGILMRGSNAVASARDDLQQATKDSCVEVQIAAAQALAQFGDNVDVERSLTRLVDLADWSKHDVFTAMAALNSLDALGEKAAPVATQIKRLPSEGKAPDARYSSYVPRLVEDLQAKFK